MTTNEERKRDPRPKVRFVTPVDSQERARAREAFPVLRHTAYLNAGTFGPLAQETVDAVAGES